MKGLTIILLSLVLLPAASAACITPSENLEIGENEAACYGIYELGSGIKIAKDNVTFDCSNSALIGSGIGYGILLNGRKNVKIQNCNISNFEIGIYLDSTNSSVIINNHLANNKFGVALYNSFGNSFDNNFLSGNVDNSISYFPASAITAKEEIKSAEKEEKITPGEIMKEVIKVKNPFLSEEEVSREVDMIFSKYLNFTEENLEIRREISYNESDGSTSIAIHLRPKKILLNVSVYEKIPKCVSEYANQIFFETAGYEIIANDPLVLWTFARIENENEVSYKVFKRIGNECKELLLSFGIAAGFEGEKAAKEPEETQMYILVSAVAVVLLALFLISRRKKSS